MNLTFREMKPEDADAVEAVEQACFAIPWSRESFWKEAANENTCYLLALDGEQVIGYAGCWISFEEAQITNIAIAPDYRGQHAPHGGAHQTGEGTRRDGDDARGAPVECTGARPLRALRLPRGRRPQEILP